MDYTGGSPAPTGVLLRDAWSRAFAATNEQFAQVAALLCLRLSGGRTRWARVEFTRINITPIILRKKIEDHLEFWDASVLYRNPLASPRADASN